MNPGTGFAGRAKQRPPQPRASVSPAGQTPTTLGSTATGSVLYLLPIKLAAPEFALSSSSPHPPSATLSGQHVAVVGAGAAGLVTARELLRAGHQPTVFEQSASVGGVWVYTPNVDDDQSGRAVERAVFSSIYATLRTNLPSDLMAFLDYPFDSRGGGQDHWPRFPHHSCVLTYLQNFCRDFDITPCLRLEHQVLAIEPQVSGWQVSSRHQGQAPVTQHFDAVVVCNGHYSKPRVPALAGIEHFQGLVIHSHNYRKPTAFADQTVVVWGAAASGADISREIASCARQVHWCGAALVAAGAAVGPTATRPNLHRHGDPVGFNPQGELLFADGSRLTDIDVLMFCTGYGYQFPFLAADIVQVTDNWVNPLYQDLVAPAYPSLAFIGLPYLVVPFPLFAMQARWFARWLAGSFSRPSAAAMQQAMADHLAALTSARVKMRNYHKLADKQTHYYNQLARQCGEPPLPNWFADLAQSAQQARLADPEHFRDQPLPS